jgi:hypothetical protein
LPFRFVHHRVLPSQTAATTTTATTKIQAHTAGLLPSRCGGASCPLLGYPARGGTDTRYVCDSRCGEPPPHDPGRRRRALLPAGRERRARRRPRLRRVGRGTGAARGTVRQRGLEAQAERLGAARAAIDLLDRPDDAGAVLDEHQLRGLGHRPRVAEARHPR